MGGDNAGDHYNQLHQLQQQRTCGLYVCICERDRQRKVSMKWGGDLGSGGDNREERGLKMVTVVVNLVLTLHQLRGVKVAFCRV